MTKFTNAFGTITAVLSVIIGFLSSVGCAPGATDFAATCQIPWLPASWLPMVAMAFGALLLVQKALRPGGFLHSMFGQTAVVTNNSGPGTVTPEQVASPK